MKNIFDFYKKNYLSEVFYILNYWLTSYIKSPTRIKSIFFLILYNKSTWKQFWKKWVMIKLSFQGSHNVCAGLELPYSRRRHSLAGFCIQEAPGNCLTLNGGHAEFTYYLRILKKEIFLIGKIFNPLLAFRGYIPVYWNYAFQFMW